MKYMLDTNICIYIIKHKPEGVIKNFMKHEPGDLSVSVITYAELLHGVEKSQAKEKNMLALTMLFAEVEILPFGDMAAQKYGMIQADLQRKGTPIGPMDTLIAAHALSMNLTLVTNNTRKFARVDGLRIEDWTLARKCY